MDSSDREAARRAIDEGLAVLGIELGSSRIKTVLIDDLGAVLASGSFTWENRNEEGIWTYRLDDVWTGLQTAFAALQKECSRLFSTHLTQLGALGISAMMHGYLVFNRDGEQLAEFRTWRNNICQRESEELTELFQYPIPQRWSIAHLCRAINNGESHVSAIDYMTTLAGYVHWKLSGQRVLGIGDASGMFPIDSMSRGYRAEALELFDKAYGCMALASSLAEILPEVLCAGEHAGCLSKEGAALLDPSGSLLPGVPMAPPEGDAGTGMAATNSLRQRTGNVSAGTSVFAMLVLEEELHALHPEIDLVTTPDGSPVAMVHSNNCSSDYDAWISLFREALELFGCKPDDRELYGKLLSSALEGDRNCGGLLSYGYVSGEHLSGLGEGRPLFVRDPSGSFRLANFFRTHLFSALCTLRMGLDILLQEEGVEIQEIRGHGGFFTDGALGRRMMAAACGVPVSTVQTAGEGGAWGVALLASYLLQDSSTLSLPDFLDRLFAGEASSVQEPDKGDSEDFLDYYRRYRTALELEQRAVALV